MQIHGHEVKWYEVPNKAVGYTCRRICEKVKERSAEKYLKQLKEHPHHHAGPIKVGFIVQMPEVWDKEKPVFDLMLEDEHFDPTLIIVPAYDFTRSVLSNYGREKQFFIDESKNNYILAKKEDGSWTDMHPEEFDYIFYQRPYNHYLPKHLRSFALAKKTKLCYIPYATTEKKEDDLVTRPKDFVQDLTIFFAEDKETVDTLNHIYHITAKIKNLQHFTFEGYPAFENALKDSGECNYYKVLWTPRWTYDSNIGGSHFFEYLPGFEKLQSEEGGVAIRPHPLMWENFIKTGRCSGEEMNEIKKRWKKIGIVEDTNEKIEDTFSTTDILVSDLSSVIAIFFLSSKPVILCPMDDFTSEAYSTLLTSILPGLYIAHTWKELEYYLHMLKDKKEDPLLEIRKKIIQDCFAVNRNATNNIIEYILDNYKSNDTSTI